LTWSDGTPLTADDSVYAFQLDAETAETGARFLLDRTQVYEAADSTRTQWWGIPGFLDPSFMTNFWAPAPKHAWGQFQAAELPQIDIASRTPIGWAPIASRSGPREITSRSPATPTTSEPRRASPNSTSWSSASSAILMRDQRTHGGSLRYLDPSVRLDGQVALLSQLEQSGEARSFHRTRQWPLSGWGWASFRHV